MKSGLELLEDLIDQVKLLNKRFEITEQNVKELLSRINLQKDTNSDKIEINNKQATIKDGTQPQLIIPQQDLKLMPKNVTKVTGRIKNKENKLASGVSVKVLDENLKIIKQTRTNMSGEWMCFLPPGKYAVEYFLQDVINAKLDVIISNGDRLINIAQPKL